MTNKKLEKGLINLTKPTYLTINSLGIGSQFIYKGRKYTKLNKDNYCILDICDESFMRCVFDPITSDYDDSIIRAYLNSDRFINKLGVDLDDLEYVYTDKNGNSDKLTLLSKDEYEQYRDLIVDYNWWWATRTAYNETYFCCVANSGYCYTNSVYNTYYVRIGFTLKPSTPIDRKGNIENDD